MEFLGYSYAEAALAGTLTAAVLGIPASLLRFALARRAGPEAGDDDDSDESEVVKWQPFPFILGFAIFWPALLCLFPFFIFDNVTARAARGKRDWAVHLVDTTAYQIIGRLVFSLGFGLMGCYVIGFFYF